MSITIDDVKLVANEYLIPFGIKLVMGVAIFVIGRWLIRVVMRALDNLMQRSRMDVSLRKFLGDIVNAALFVVLSLAALDTVGIKTTALVAVLGGAALAVGLALQGSLSNFAAGVMLIVLRPYKVNDLVTIGAFTGRVDAIRVFSTTLITGDNREVSIPNGQIIAQPISNLSILGARRVDLIINVPPATDLAAARRVLLEVVANDERVLKEPATTIDVGEITDGGVKLLFRPWTQAPNHFRVMVETIESAQRALAAAGIKGAVGALPSLVPIPVAAA